MNISPEEKKLITELNKMADTDGYELLKEYFYKEIFDSVTKVATEKDIVFNAGIKAVFEYVEDKIKILRNY